MQPGAAARAKLTASPVDPFSSGKQGAFSRFLNLFLATAIFQCWYFVLGFSVWATIITVIWKFVYDISVQSTLLTVLGTVLGFVISYRTSSSFERYNEGRRYWSTIIFNARTFARTTWFHVPDIAVAVGGGDEEKRARTLVEKKTALNLVEAFAVAVKHYLRGEEGIHYEDLYHQTKFLPAYALPAGRPDMFHQDSDDDEAQPTGTSTSTRVGGLPMPVTSPRRTTFSEKKRNNKSSVNPDGTPVLLPSRNPPSFSLFDIFPLTLLVKPLTKRGFDLGGKTAQRARAKLGLGRGLDGDIVSHNIPLEITLYLSSYVSALQQRKVCDVPTINMLLNSLNALVDSLTGLERILTTPIPFSYSVHLWTVTLLYCALLPFQLLKTLDWLTIPGTAIASFIFTGFLVAGEEIENPFGFDRNDLNLDHFTHNIIRAELVAITSVPVPDPAKWAFAPMNDYVFAQSGDAQWLSPESWVKQGNKIIENQLAKGLAETPDQEKKSKKNKKKIGTDNVPEGHAPGNAAGVVGAGGAAGGAAGDTGGDGAAAGGGGGAGGD